VDLYKGSVEPANQVHDFNPGNDALGLFWTIPIARENLRAYPEDGSVVLDLSNVALADYGTVANFFMGKPSIPSTLNLRIEWSGNALEEQVFHSETDNFEARLRKTTVSVTASASTPSTGFSFSNDVSTTMTEYAVVGSERNGSFLPGAGGDGQM